MLIDDNDANISFYAFLCIWNGINGHKTPKFHIKISAWLEKSVKSENKNLLLLSFRNSGKSSLLGLFCAWLLLKNKNVKILILSGDTSLARKMVAHAKQVLERHPLTKKLIFPGKIARNRDQFSIRSRSTARDPSIMAKGIHGNITGLRADVIICDDVEVPNTCNTYIQRTKLRSRLREIDYIINPGGIRIIAGTPHSYFSIYSDENELAQEGEKTVFFDFQRLIVPIIDHKGRSSWPDRYPPSRIDEIRQRSGPAKFESQMLLKPRNPEETRLEPEKIRRYSDELIYMEQNCIPQLYIGDHRMVSASCWWDPSFGSPDRGDRSVIAVVYGDQEGRFFLHRIKYISFRKSLLGHETEASQLCRQVREFIEDLYLPALTIEINGIGRFLPGLLRQELLANGLKCSVREKTSSRNKDLRILEAFDAALAAGRLWAHHSVWKTPLIAEMREWQPGTSRQDDGLDAVSGCILSEPCRIPRWVKPSVDTDEGFGDWRRGGEPFAAKTSFEV